MNEQELKSKYAARKCESQMEFDRIMSDMNAEQTKMNHPYLDRLRELHKQRELLETQMSALRVQLKAIGIEILDIEGGRKPINRLFHELKHELIMANPRENFVRTTE